MYQLIKRVAGLLQVSFDSIVVSRANVVAVATVDGVIVYNKNIIGVEALLNKDMPDGEIKDIIKRVNDLNIKLLTKYLKANNIVVVDTMMISPDSVKAECVDAKGNHYLYEVLHDTYLTPNKGVGEEADAGSSLPKEFQVEEYKEERK